MKKMRQTGKRIRNILLAVLLGFGLAFTGYAPEASAAGAVTELANLVVFVKMHGAEGNVFDEITSHGTYVTDNWKVIRDMYDGENSLSDYVSVITCGKVSVTNIFPQEYMRSGESRGIGILELSQERYDTDDAMVQEVIREIGNAQPGDPLYVGDQFLDRNGDGCVDNLTVIVQGDDINGEYHSFKADYGGNESINGLYVRCYNALPSKMLFYKSVHLHEFLHTLGLPDLYSLNGSSDAAVTSGPVGIWDVMASAGGPSPQYVMGYLRKEKGWLEGSSVAEIATGGTYTLSAVSQPDTAGGVRLYTISPTLPQGESQTICLEYRRAMPAGEYDHLVYGGLLMYRVDDMVQDHTNIKGENYIYVYRPGCATANECGTATVEAALDVTAGETSYGSTDLSAAVSEDTLHYADGSNSGVRISNLRLSSDETEITFDVEFAEYGDDWQALGGVAANDALSDVTLHADSDGTLYLGYINTSKQVRILRWDQTANVWKQMGDTLPAGNNSSVAMADCNGQLYVAYWSNGSEHYPVYSVWNGSGWSAAARIDTVSTPNSLQLVVEGSEVYAAYEVAEGNQKRLVIRNLNGTLVTNDRTARDFSNPRVVKQGDLFYVAYGDYPNTARIDSYNTVTGTWKTVLDYGACGNVNLLHRQGTKLYGLSGMGTIPGEAQVTPVLSVWDGSAWTKTAVPQMSRYYDVSLLTAGETVYLVYLDNISKQVGMLRFQGGSFVSCYDGLNGNADELEAAAVGDQVYVASRSGTSVTVRCQKVESDPIVTPPPLTISLTPPEGYDNADVYIDGIKYTATKSGSSYTLQLPDKTGRTAVMYYYNERNVPKGMYVWRLSYQGDTCIATPMPGLQDLLSYHGFSIRVKGYSGLRFKSGINIQKRAQLLGSGVDGYHLTEYGTLFIPDSYLQRYPLVRGGEMVSGGRSYWTENGVVNDRIFETVDGRYRFASVLTRLPAKQYATELVFRSYAVLQGGDGEQLVIYGPPVARSIYTVAKQILAAGEFKPGSSGYNYVKSIVNAVEGRN
ncbi:MAG: hypothetical protein NC420_12230 [Eubacterium sp.]|nr:hypothetical protein [Eubacterium sp.]MCM1215789.1 hypothetical protein [Lachnospiraceae bacterium]MCM1304125.1 hypothetical protein [Butyrivibrio sp.]MCM1344083.1 hypothetical protein [Muribaculaceae bacterium]MCM1238352.1 hypothetical protein [Lachnospiraceae bacterium]